jgi:hypothetical protein
LGEVNRNAALTHYFFQLPIANRTSHIPTDASKDDTLLELAAFEIYHRRFTV